MVQEETQLIEDGPAQKTRTERARHVYDIDPEEAIKRLIQAKELSDYVYFVEKGVTTSKELEELTKAVSDPQKERYNRGAKAQYEMQLVDRIIENSSLDSSLEIVREAQEQDKSHIAVEVLKPRGRPLISISYKGIESIVRNFILSLACNQYTFGTCVENCQYDVKWDKQYNCGNVVQKGFELLKNYSPDKTSDRRAQESLANIMGM